MEDTQEQSVEECLDKIDDLERENSTLRMQRDEYARQLIAMQDRVHELEHCSNCEEAHRDAYVARMQLARLQAIVTSPRQELQRSISLSDDHVSTEADVPMKMSAERCAHSVADITALMSKLEYFKQAFASLQADNKDLRHQIDFCRDEETRMKNDADMVLQSRLQKSEQILLAVKSERNNYRSKANSLSKELLHCELANNKRIALIADLRLELYSHKGDIQFLRKKITEMENRSSTKKTGSIMGCISRRVGSNRKVNPSKGAVENIFEAPLSPRIKQHSRTQSYKIKCVPDGLSPTVTNKTTASATEHDKDLSSGDVDISPRSVASTSKSIGRMKNFLFCSSY